MFASLVTRHLASRFHGWPAEALVSVAQRFLADIPNVEDSVREGIAYHMAFAHQCVTEASVRYLEAFRRYNYTTPKSYLELIALYKSLLHDKRGELRAAKERLENGVDKIAQASAQVADLQAALKEEQIIVEEKKAQTDDLIVSIGKEKAVVDEAVEVRWAGLHLLHPVARGVCAHPWCVKAW
jgi:dynein heavy chain, axonemal